MRKIRLAGPCAALLALGCSGGLKDLGNRFPGPTALASFVGISAKRPGVLHPYVAVASTRGDELRLIDPEDDAIVAGPGGIFPLAIPTTAGRPTRIVSTPLDRGASPPTGADLVVVVGAGSLLLEVLDAWSGVLRIDRSASVDLALDPAIGPGATLGAVAASPVPGVAGRARVFAALSGGRLAVVEFERIAGGAVHHRTTTVKDLAFGSVPAFEVRDISVAPDGLRIFCATGDAIGEKPDPAAPGGPPVPVFGVAQIDVPTDASAAWTLFPLDALAPTQLVAAATVDERLLADTTQYGGAPRLEVFASLDPSGCGTRSAIECGIATLLPDQGLAPDPIASNPKVDPSWKMPYRAPIPVPGIAMAMAVLEPPAGSSKLALLYGGSATNETTAALAVVSSAGRVYFVDLARWALAASNSYVSGDGRTWISSAGALYQTDKQGNPLPALTLRGAGGAAIDPVKGTNADQIRSAIGFTPGYTYSDSWSLTWQGTLPAYKDLFGSVGRDAGGPWLAFQVPSGLVATPGVGFWKVLQPLGPPELGLRLDDLVDVTSSLDDCVNQAGEPPVASGFRTRVTAILPPDPVQWPGGAVRLADLGCMDRGVAATPVGVVASIRASKLVLAGASFGYAGRPALEAPYEVRWKPEQGLAPEELDIVRRARRREYPPGTSCSQLASTTCVPVDPIAPGPVVSFTASQWNPPGATAADMPVGTAVIFASSATVAPMFRQPATGAAGPIGVLALDHGIFPGQQGSGVHVYVSYSDDQVGLVVPGGSTIFDRAIR